MVLPDSVTYSSLVLLLLYKCEKVASYSPTPLQSAIKNRDRIQLTSDSLLEEKAKKIKARDEVCWYMQCIVKSAHNVYSYDS